MNSFRRSLAIAVLAAGTIALISVGLMCATPSVAYTGPDLLGAPTPAGPASGPLRLGKANTRYFCDANGKPVYLTGAHTWTSLQDIGIDNPPAEFDFDGYLGFLHAHRFNFIRLWRWEVTQWVEPSTKRVMFCPLQPWQRIGPGTALDGKPKFDLEKFDEAYFQRLRTRVEEAGRRGVYVSIMLFEGWVVRFAPDDWRHHPFNSANNVNAIEGDTNRDGKGLEIYTATPPAVARVQEAYVRHVIDTVNDLDNVLYEICNENDPASIPVWQTHLVCYIREYELRKPKQHPIGVTSAGHGNPGEIQHLLATPADWISPNPDDYDYKSDPPLADGSKVVIPDTDHLWGLGGDAQWVWKSFTRGMNPIFMDPYRGVFLERSKQEPQWQAVRRALGHTAFFASRVNLARMVPQPSLASTGYCLADSGTEYLVYLPFEPHPLESTRGVRRAKKAIRNFRSHLSRDVVVDLSSASGNLQVEWFDPAKGESIRGALVEGGHRRSFTAPFKGDAVLYIRKEHALN